MGICFDTGNINYYISSTKLPPPVKIAALTEYLEHIRQALSLETLPWDESMPRQGTLENSANYSRYALVLELAEGSFPETQYMLGSAPLANLSKEERFEQFRHFLDHDIYTTFYLPIDFNPPQHLHNAVLDEDFVIGSSVRLGREMWILRQIVQLYAEKYGENSQADLRELWGNIGKHHWSSLYAFCDNLYAACVESLELNIPVLLKY